MPKKIPAIERVLARIVLGEIEYGDGDRCWLWPGAKDGDGYATVWLDGRMVSAHRVSYLSLVGPVPDGLVLDHWRCQTRTCVNPAHLEPVTNKENVLRGTGFAPQLASRTHCPMGHALVEGNLRKAKFEKTGRRECARCHSDREQVRQAKRAQHRAQPHSAPGAAAPRKEA